MTQPMTKTTTLRGSATLLIAALLAVIAATPAEARGRHRPRGGRVIVAPYGGFYGPSPFFYRFGYAALHHDGVPWAGSGTSFAAALGVGGLDLNVKPRSAEVFVDGTYRGKVRDFDGYARRPTYLWLPEGEHTIAISKGGYPTFEQTFDIEPGLVVDVKLKLAEQTNG